MTKIPKVGIVVLNWNNSTDTLDCLASLEKLSYSSYFTLVIDNASTDNSVYEIGSNYPTIRIISLPENLGYAGGNNIGIDQALNMGADYVLVLNNDTYVDPNMLSELVKVAESNPMIGILGPKMYCSEPANYIFASGSFVNWKVGDLNHRGMFEIESSITNEDPECVDFIVGCGLLINKKCLDAIGYFNTKYYLNYEDVELGIRAWKNGYKVVYVPKAVMWHKISATLGIASPANTYYMTRNALLFFSQYTPFHLRYIVVSRIILRTLKTIIVWSIKTKYRTKIYQNKKYSNILALRDFFIGRYGKMGTVVSKNMFIGG